MRLMRCSGLCDSNGRSRSTCILVGSRPIERRIWCWPEAQSVSVRNQTMNEWVTGKCRALMFENTPRMVCLPEPGSMWTPSQVSLVSSWGLDCMVAVGRGAQEGANHFAWSGGAGGVNDWRHVDRSEEH